MSNDRNENLPALDGPDAPLDPSINIGTINYNPNSLTELRKIAEKNPSLAEKIVDSQYRAGRWFSISEIVGMSVAAMIALAGIAGFVFIVVKLGWWQSIVFILLMLGLSHLVRTILTGEWSDTSWFGKILKRAGAPPAEGDNQ